MLSTDAALAALANLADAATPPTLIVAALISNTLGLAFADSIHTRIVRSAAHPAAPRTAVVTTLFPIAGVEDAGTIVTNLAAGAATTITTAAIRATLLAFASMVDAGAIVTDLAAGAATTVTAAAIAAALLPVTDVERADPSVTGLTTPAGTAAPTATVAAALLTVTGVENTRPGVADLPAVAGAASDPTATGTALPPFTRQGTRALGILVADRKKLTGNNNLVRFEKHQVPRIVNIMQNYI